jgi:hypothetical protein
VPLFTAGSTCGNARIISEEERPTIMSHDSNAEVNQSVNQQRLNIDPEVGEKCNAWGETRNTIKFSVMKPHLEDVDGRIILKWILENNI